MGCHDRLRLARAAGRAIERRDLLRRPGRVRARLHRGGRRARPAGRRSPLPALLRGSPRSAGPRVRERGRRHVRAPHGCMGAAAAQGAGGRRRPSAPASPDADQRGGRARVSRRAARGAPARHRAADARPDRRRTARRVGPRRRVGRADARLGASLRAAARALSGRGAPCAGPAGGGARARGVGAQRVRSRGLRPPPARRRAAARALAALARGGAARLGRARASRAASPTATKTSRRLPRADPCCSTWAATPRSSASRS